MRRQNVQTPNRKIKKGGGCISSDRKEHCRLHRQRLAWIRRNRADVSPRLRRTVRYNLGYFGKRNKTPPSRPRTGPKNEFDRNLPGPQKTIFLEPPSIRNWFWVIICNFRPLRLWADPRHRSVERGWPERHFYRNPILCGHKVGGNVNIIPLSVQTQKQK